MNTDELRTAIEQRLKKGTQRSAESAAAKFTGNGDIEKRMWIRDSI